MPLEEVELRAPRLKAPSGLGDLFSDERHERVSPRAGQGLPGRRARLPGGVREPARPGRAAPRRVGDRGGAELGRGRGRGGDPFGGGTSVVGGVEGAARRAAVRLASTCAGSTGCWRSTPTSLAARIQAGATGPRPRGAAARARPHPAPLPAVLRVLDPGRLGRDPGRRPLRHPLHPHRRPGRVGAGDHAARDLGEPAAAGLGRRPLARPGADRLRGDPRRDRRGLGPGAARGPRFKVSCGVEFDDFLAAAGAVRAISQSGLNPANCRLLDALEAGTTGAGTRREEPARSSASSPPTTRSRTR